MAALCRDVGLNLVLTKLGEGTATREQLSVYGLDRTEKAVVSAVAGADAKKQVFRAAKRKLFLDIPGNGIMMAVPIKSVGGGRTLTYLTNSNVPSGGVPDMKFEYELIVVILSEGFSDTVLHAKGTAAGQSEKFFSVSLADEKDVIYIVSTGREKAAIMRAITSQAGPETRAGAICFSLPVSSVAGLRRLDDEE
ncbi:MAG: P-II family nitrogen regulator [Clostridiales bacterium]|nr:P-II family nitrogen regulator [Clostridiales bacterium]